MAFKVLWLRGTCNGVAIKEKIYFQRGYRVRSAKKPNKKMQQKKMKETTRIITRPKEDDFI